MVEINRFKHILNISSNIFDHIKTYLEQVQTYHVTEVAKQHHRYENMWKKYKGKVERWWEEKNLGFLQDHAVIWLVLG